MKISTWLNQAGQYLASAHIPTARLDSLVILEDILGKDRAWILANPDSELESVQIKKLKNLLKRRSQHMPLAYLRGKTEFYGREFIITPAVLEPRPESETMIACLRDILKDHASSFKKRAFVRIADIGSGSGAIGITVALEIAKTKVDLIEIDPKAIEVSKMNVDKFTLNINIIKSNLLELTHSPYDILLCNLPYVPDDFNINLAATHEPKLAIFGGPDGLSVYRQLFKQISGLINKPLYILTESLPPQHDKLSNIARLSNYNLTGSDDFIQVFRYSL